MHIRLFCGDQGAAIDHCRNLSEYPDPAVAAAVTLQLLKLARAMDAVSNGRMLSAPSLPLQGTRDNTA